MDIFFKDEVDKNNIKLGYKVIGLHSKFLSKRPIVILLYLSVLILFPAVPQSVTKK